MWWNNILRVVFKSLLNLTQMPLLKKSVRKSTTEKKNQLFLANVLEFWGGPAVLSEGLKLILNCLR